MYWDPGSEWTDVSANSRLRMSKSKLLVAMIKMFSRVFIDSTIAVGCNQVNIKVNYTYRIWQSIKRE